MAISRRCAPRVRECRRLSSREGESPRGTCWWRRGTRLETFARQIRLTDRRINDARKPVLLSLSLALLLLASLALARGANICARRPKYRRYALVPVTRLNDKIIRNALPRFHR